MKHIYLLGITLTLLLSACSEQEVTEKVVGLKPVYGTLATLSSSIKTTENEPMKSVGKIYVYQNKLLINEVTKGVHIFDNADPSNPIPLKFIAIPGNVDVAIKDNFMYADLGVGLVTIDISDLDNVVVTSFDQNYINSENLSRPPASATQLITSERVYFECPDVSKGLVISWEQEEMPKPECYIIQ